LSLKNLFSGNIACDLSGLVFFTQHNILQNSLKLL
jgi:hypothetical protein